MNFQIWIEAIFFISLVLKFLTDFIPDGEQQPTKDLTLIAKNYLRKGFIWDLIPILPFTFIFYGNNNAMRLSCFIKLVRIINGVKLFDVRMLFKVM